MALDLTSRSLGHTQKLDKFTGTTAFVTFSNIGHDGDAGPTYLIAKSKIFPKGSIARDGINILGQLSCPLPGFNIPERLE